jgi:hypothetical protein
MNPEAARVPEPATRSLVPRDETGGARLANAPSGGNSASVPLWTLADLDGGNATSSPAVSAATEPDTLLDLVSTLGTAIGSTAGRRRGVPGGGATESPRGRPARGLPLWAITARPAGPAPESRRPTPYDDAIFNSREPWLPPEIVLPDDPDQQRATIAPVNAELLWLEPHRQDVFHELAVRMEKLEPSKHDAAFWLRYWHARFTASVHYILEVRSTHRHVAKKTQNWYPARAEHLMRLHEAEAEVLARPPAENLGAEVRALWALGAVARVGQLREAARTEWLEEVRLAADRFLAVAQNETLIRTEHQSAREVRVYGLPEELEGTLPPSAFPALFEGGGPGFSPSTARFMAALQKASGQRVQATNYPGHETSNYYVGDPEHIGKYSFDVEPDIPKDANGLYEPAKMVLFFLAMERAAQETDIAWTAYYNDFTVAKQVNEQIGWRRVDFSGGGGPRNATPDQQGSFHHGPFPYILHVHVNIMPRGLARQYLAGRADLPLAIDLGQRP